MKNQALVAAFVEGNVQNRFLIIAKTLKEFIDKEAPIIERTNAALNVVWKKTIFEIQAKEMELSIRTDAQNARQVLTIYNRTFGRIDHHLSMMSSNYQLPHFLEENGIPLNEIMAFQEDIQGYWAKTYGPLIEAFSGIKKKLNLLRSILEQEVNLLEKLPTASYIEGLAQSQELRTLFGMERKLFWEIVAAARMVNKRMNEVERLYAVQKRQTKEMIKAHLNILQTSVKRDWMESELRVKKALVILSYLSGALNVYLNLKQILITKVTSGIFTYVTERKERKISEISRKTIKSLDNATGSVLQELANSL